MFGEYLGNNFFNKLVKKNFFIKMRVRVVHRNRLIGSWKKMNILLQVGKSQMSPIYKILNLVKFLIIRSILRGCTEFLKFRRACHFFFHQKTQQQNV